MGAATIWLFLFAVFNVIGIHQAMVGNMDMVKYWVVVDILVVFQVVGMIVVEETQSKCGSDERG